MKTRFAAVIALLAVVGTIGLVSCNKSQAPRQGQTIKHTLGYDIHIETPMDFMGVTDHSEYVRVTKQANTGNLCEQAARGAPLIMKNPNDPDEQQKVFLYLLSLTSEPPIKSFMSPQVAVPVWTDKTENPEKMLKPVILDMDNQFKQVKTQVAIALADLHLLQREEAGQPRQARRLDVQSRARCR
jgi:hypothetical protein